MNKQMTELLMQMLNDSVQSYSQQKKETMRSYLERMEKKDIELVARRQARRAARVKRA